MNIVALAVTAGLARRAALAVAAGPVDVAYITILTTLFSYNVIALAVTAGFAWRAAGIAAAGLVVVAAFTCPVAATGLGRDAATRQALAALISTSPHN